MHIGSYARRAGCTLTNIVCVCGLCQEWSSDPTHRTYPFLLGALDLGRIHTCITPPPSLSRKPT